MLDLPDILPHLVHTDAVQGGALVFGGDRVAPVLSIESFVSGDDRRAPRPRPSVVVTRGPRGRERRTADSAEAMRSLKASMGVPQRPVTVPVDVWSRN